jgi:hypothetical protein
MSASSRHSSVKLGSPSHGGENCGMLLLFESCRILLGLCVHRGLIRDLFWQCCGLRSIRTVVDCRRLVRNTEVP